MSSLLVRVAGGEGRCRLLNQITRFNVAKRIYTAKVVRRITAAGFEAVGAYDDTAE